MIGYRSGGQLPQRGRLSGLPSPPAVMSYPQKPLPLPPPPPPPTQLDKYAASFVKMYNAHMHQKAYARQDLLTKPLCSEILKIKLFVYFTFVCKVCKAHTSQGRLKCMETCIKIR